MSDFHSDPTRPLRHVVSMSYGKDSTATLLLALATVDPSTVIAAFAETDNEHPLVYEYAAYLTRELGVPTVNLRADFTDRIARKRNYVDTVWREEGVPADVVERAMAALVPTGNAMLDLCIWKGRFPSRRAQFCTEELKTTPLMNYQLSLIEQGFAVWSWQGIRADESINRRYRAPFAQLDDHLFVNLPILRWTAADTFEAMAYCGIKPNPLYTQGMKRVGCMPCVNCGKDELAEIAKRWPEVIARIAEWEACVKAASKRGGASFFPAPEDGRADLQGRNIAERVEWARTSRGGLQHDIFADLPAPACSSFYQLCE